MKKEKYGADVPIVVERNGRQELDPTIAPDTSPLNEPPTELFSNGLSTEFPQPSLLLTEVVKD